jgi:hypothetical protein
MINYSSFADEMTKISEEQKREATKPRLKRLMTTVVPATAIGTGLGVGTGKLISSKMSPARLATLNKSFGRKYGPGMLGGAAGIVGGLAAYRSRRIKKYLDDGKERRSK